MPKVKDRYLKPVLKLYDINKKWICNLTTNNPKNSIFNLKKNMKVNEVDTLSFQIAFDNTHISPNSCEMLIKHEFDWYIIKSVTLNSGDTRYLNVECESEFTISKTVLCEPIEIIGETPKKMFSDIMEAIPDNKLNYVFKETDVTNKRSLIVESETSLFENLIKMAEAFECTVRFSYGSDGIKYVSFIKEPHDRGRVIRRNNNLKNLNIIYDTSELFTKIMPFGADDDGIEINIGDVNPTKKLYVENYDYFVAKGMTEEQIKNNMQAQALKVIKYADIVDENDLYNLALRDLKKYSKPRVKGTVEYADLSVLEDSISIEPLIHERIKITDSEIKMTLSSEISEIEIDYENILNSKITLDNVIEYNSIFKDLIAQGEKIDSVIGTNPNTGKPSLIAGAIQGKIDAAVAGIVGQVDVAEKMVPYAILFECNIEGHDLYGAVALGTKGLLIAKEKNMDNSWKWKTAINANGVYADELVGLTIMGEQIIAGTISSLDKSTWINLEDGAFNFADKIKFVDGKFTIALSSGQTLDEWKDEYEQNKNDIDKDIADIQDQLEGVIGDIGGALTDGIIDELEMNIIKDRLVQFNKEKDDITMRYNNLYGNSSLSGTAKSNLKAKYDLFILKHNSLVKTINEIIEDRKATDEERKAFSDAVKEYNAVIPQLSKAFDDALNCISKNTSQSLIEQTEESIRLEVKNVKEGLESNIKQTADAIYSKVSSVENKITASNGDVSGLVDRIESAEQKITATAILNAVNEQIGKGGAITTTSTKLEKNKFTIYNGSLIVQNNKKKDVMWCNTEGWLTAANLFINGGENPSNLEIGGVSGNKGVGIRTNGDGYSAYLDFGVLDRNATFAENVKTGQYHRFITEASDRSMLNLVTPRFNIRPFTGYDPVELTVQGYIEAFHDISTRHNINAVGEITAGGFKRSDTGYTLIATDTIDTIKYAKNDKSYLEVKTPKFGTWGVDIWASDEKLKENISKIDLREELNIDTVDEKQQKIGLDLINNMNHYSFDYIESFGGSHVNCGYIAQELKELNDSLVLEIKQEDGSTILQPSVPNIIPNITFALQQQQAEIEELKREIKELKSLIK